MGTGHSRGGFRGLVSVVALLGLLGERSWAAEVHPSASLVQQALASELRGDNAQRQALLEEALQQTPDAAAAHWQAGQVFLDGAWRTPHEVARMAAQDARLDQYHQLREAMPPTAEGQAALARWCRKNHLDDEQRIHWIAVLKDQPQNAEALQALNRLGLRPFEGRLRTQAEIEQIKAEMQSWQKALETWRPLVGEWHRQASRPDATMPTELHEKIRHIVSRVEMRAMNQCVWLSVGKDHRGATYHTMVLALVAALGENRTPAAAEALACYAVGAEQEDVRAAAITELKRHPLDHYVPLLLAELRGELEGGLRFDVTASGALVSHETRFQEGGLTDAQGEIVGAPAGQGTMLILNPSSRTRGNMALAHATTLADSQTRAAAAAEVHQAALEQANTQIAARNARVVAVLRATTGQDLEAKMSDWWAWWQDYNGKAPRDASAKATAEAARQDRWIASHADQAMEEQTRIDQSSPASQSGSYRTSQSPGFTAASVLDRLPVTTPLGNPECFAPGTKVWTLAGPVPIETIQMGDRVLSQDPESGELAYKPVLAVTLREDGPRTQVDVDGETLVSTTGHPFWIAGQGWLPARALQATDRLHTVSGSASVSAVRALTVAEAGYTKAHNLILQEFHTFFVGERGVLVHDGTSRAATANLLPGLAASADQDQDLE